MVDRKKRKINSDKKNSSTGKKSKRKIKRRVALKAVIVLAVFTIMAVSLAALTINFTSKHLLVSDIRAVVEVGNEVAFNVTSEALDFGTVLPGGHSTKRIILDSENFFITTNEYQDWLFIRSVERQESGDNEKTIITFVARPGRQEQGRKEVIVTVRALDKPMNSLEKNFFVRGHEVLSEETIRDSGQDSTVKINITN